LQKVLAAAWHTIWPIVGFAVIPAAAGMIGLGFAPLYDPSFAPAGAEPFIPRGGARLLGSDAHNLLQAFLGLGGLALGMVGALLFVGVALAAELVARRIPGRRAILRKMVHVVLGVGAFATIGNALLTLGIVTWLTELVRHGSFPVAFGALTVVGAAGMAVTLTYWIFVGTFELREPRVVAAPAFRGDQRVLWDLVDAVAEDCGGASPDQVYLVATPDFSLRLKESRRAGLNPQLAGRTLYLSMPLLAVLSESDLRILLTYCLAPLPPDDVETLSGELLRLREATRALFEWRVAKAFTAMATIVAFPLLGILYFAGNRIRAALYRIRTNTQRQMDRFVASMYGALATASTLLKVAEARALWEIHVEEIRWQPGARLPDGATLRALFAEALNDDPTHERVMWRNRTGPLTPYIDRLRGLGADDREGAWAGLPWRLPADPAARALVRDADAVEARLDLSGASGGKNAEPNPHPSSNVVTP
jgi:hypothetical protein